MDELRFTKELLESEGMSVHELLKATRAGQWDRLRRGAYLQGQEADARRRHLLLIAATMPQVRDESVVSHASAAVLHGLPVPREQLDRVWMTREVGGHGRRGAVLHLRHCRLHPDEVTEVGGLPVTTLARTVVDVARSTSLEWGVIACDAALGIGLDRMQLLETVARVRGWPGARRAERAALFADSAAQSPLESVSRLQLARLGLPTPQCQFPVLLNGELVATSDFGWRNERLIGECDGRTKYGDLLRPGEDAADAVMREKRREERIRAAGYWIVRWGWDEAWNPAVLRRIVERGFALAPGVRTAS